jgi:hypothetical protein
MSFSAPWFMSVVTPARLLAMALAAAVETP